MARRIDRLVAPLAPTSAPTIKPTPRGGPVIDFVPATLLPGKPQEMTWRDYLVLLLHVAAELEHGLMVEYLYAAYTLGGPDAAKHERTIREWHDKILTVAREEMGHLITVQNLLVLIGGPVNFDRQDFPWSSPFYPFEFALEPLSLRTLAQFVYAEMPRKLQRKPDIEARSAVMKLVDTDRPTVGEIYDQIIAIIEDEAAIPDSVFDASSYPYQSSWDEWGRGYRPGTHQPYAQNPDIPPPNQRKTTVIVEQMASRTEALAALREVAGQGEAEDLKPGEKTEPSHFDRFAAVFRAYEAILAKEPDFKPYHDVATNPFAGAPRTAPPRNTPITGRVALPWAGLFNIRYRMLLALLTYTYRIPRDAPDSHRRQRPHLLSSIFGEMYNLKAIAGILVRLPLTDDPKETRRAAPPFQMPYTLSPPLPEANYWKMHLDLLSASAGLVNRLLDPSLASESTVDGVRFLKAMRQADDDARHWITEVLAGLEASRRALT